MTMLPSAKPTVSFQCISVYVEVPIISTECPKNPIVLAHGLLGFDEFHIAGKFLPGLHYWRGITEVLASNGVEVITASVPASASIEQRAERLGRDINKKAAGKSVNIVA